MNWSCVRLGMMGDMHADAHKRSNSLQQHMHAVTTWPNPGKQITHLNPIKHNHTQHTYMQAGRVSKPCIKGCCQSYPQSMHQGRATHKAMWPNKQNPAIYLQVHPVGNQTNTCKNTLCSTEQGTNRLPVHSRHTGYHRCRNWGNTAQL